MDNDDSTDQKAAQNVQEPVLDAPNGHAHSTSAPIDLTQSEPSISVAPLDLEDEEKRCRLDRGLFALLYHELISARLESTAKKLLREAGVESVEFSGGVPPRLRDLVDAWNERQSAAPVRKLIAVPHVTTISQSKPLVTSVSSASTNSSSRPATSSSSGAAAPSPPKGKDIIKPKQYTAYVRPYPGNKPTSVREQEKLMTGKGTRGPWLQEEEQRLKDAVELYGDSNLEVIDAFVKTRSLKGIGKHFLRTKKAWGLENNRKIFEALLTDPIPTMERLMHIKPEERGEKDIVTWLEWFIIHNNCHHPEEHVALAAKQKSDIEKAEKDRIDKEKLMAQQSVLAAAVAAANTTAPVPLSSSSAAREVVAVDPPLHSSAIAPASTSQPASAPAAAAPARATAPAQVSTTQHSSETSKSPPAISADKKDSSKAVLPQAAPLAKPKVAATPKQTAEVKSGSGQEKKPATEKKASPAPPPPKRARLHSVAWTQMEEELLKRYYSQFKGDLRRITKRLPNKTQEDVEEHIQEMQSIGALPLIVGKHVIGT